MLAVSCTKLSLPKSAWRIWTKLCCLLLQQFRELRSWIVWTLLGNCNNSDKNCDCGTSPINKCVHFMIDCALVAKSACFYILVGCSAFSECFDSVDQQHKAPFGIILIVKYPSLTLHQKCDEENDLACVVRTPFDQGHCKTQTLPNTMTTLMIWDVSR